MKFFWALPAALRLALALERPFSVQNDLLAFPQYDVVFSESFIPAHEAEARLEEASKASDTPSSEEQHDAGAHSEQQILGDAQHGYDEARDQYERMVLNQTPYLCRIPFVSPESIMGANSSASSQAEQQQELVRASDHGWELLSAMEGNCMYFGGGWWVYSFCYGESIRQFHPLTPGRDVPAWPPTPDPAVFNFVLARFKQNGHQNRDPARGEGIGDAAFDSDMSSELQTRGETNFLVQKLGGGTICDLTGLERRVEIQYHCNPGSPDRISLIKETASCVYLFVVHTPRLCNDVAFMPPQLDRPNLITCQEIVSKDDENRWKAVKAAKAKDELFGGKESNDGQQSGGSTYINVGGIQVGAQKLVGGSPERQIKVSNIAKPRKLEDNQERFIATLAESDGKKLTVLNEREIQKYDLKTNLEDIEDLIIQTENWAETFREGQPWRLDVVQTPDGTHFRGILMNDDGSEADKASAADTEKQGDGQNQQGSREEYKQARQP